MANERIDLETSLVAQELRPKLIRVEKSKLKHQTIRSHEITNEHVEYLTATVTKIGVLTPVLVDGTNSVIAGQGLLQAATQIGLDDIPAIKIADLTTSELEIYVNSMARYFRLAELDKNAFFAETQQVRELLALAQAGAETPNEPSDLKFA